jgi:hypothetical protein
MLKCQYAQGYLFSEPMDVMAADLFIRNAAQGFDANVTSVVSVEFAM